MPRPMALVAGLVLLASGCSSGTDGATSSTTAATTGATSSTTAATTGTPAPVSSTGSSTSTTLPSGFVTSFVDHAENFTISYPGDWEVIIEASPVIVPDTPVFQAARVSPDGTLLPNLNIFFDIFPTSVSSDELADVNLDGFVEGTVIHDRRQVSLAGVEELATIIEVEFPESSTELALRLHGFLLFSGGGRTVESVGCLGSVQDLDTCRAVVTSFGIVTDN